MEVMPEVTLSSCDKIMPVIGMGTAVFPPGDPETVKAAMIEAIKAGYRHFDTAFIYQTEKPLGEAIAEALRLGLIRSRDELFITSKLFATYAEKDMVVPAINISLRNLQLDYLDMYLIHVPLKINTSNVYQIPYAKEDVFPMDIKSVWEGMEESKNLGLTKAIGVCNFSCKKLENLLSFAKIPPSVVHAEMNPMWHQKEMREFCKANDIQFVGYSPLGANSTIWGDNRIVECDVLHKIAKAKGKTPAQVSLRWVYQQGACLIAKTFNKDRMKENLDIFNWSLTEDELDEINKLPQRRGIQFAKFWGPVDLIIEMDQEI